MTLLQRLARYIGPGPKMLFAADTKTEADHVIFHFVQFHTLHFTNDGHADKAEFKTISTTNDERLEQFRMQIEHTNRHDPMRVVKSSAETPREAWENHCAAKRVDSNSEELEYAFYAGWNACNRCRTQKTQSKAPEQKENT